MPAIEADILRAILQSQLEHLSPEAREASAAIAVSKLNQTLGKARIPPLPPLPPAENARMENHLRCMKADGITLLGPMLNTGQVAQIQDSLQDKNLYGGHVWTVSDRIGRPKAEIRRHHRQGSYLLQDVLDAPHLLETMSSPFMLKLVEGYLGGLPTVFQSNLMWSFEKRPGTTEVAQYFHRDWDNFRFCVLFVYLSDVDAQNGAHQYVRGSHTLAGMQACIDRYRRETGSDKWAPDAFYHEGAGLSDHAVVGEVFGKDILQIEKLAGTAFLADAFGLHRGLPLEKGERLLFWARYGLYDNGFSADVTPAPLAREAYERRMPDTVTHRYIFRALLQSEFTHAPNVSMHVDAPTFEMLMEELLCRFGKWRFILGTRDVVWKALRYRLSYWMYRLNCLLKNPSITRRIRRKSR